MSEKLLKRVKNGYFYFENGLAIACLGLITFLPAIEVILRRFQTGMTGSTTYIYHLVLWITFIGGMITSREERHLALSATMDFIKEPVNTWIQSVTAGISAGVSASLAWSSFYFLQVGIDPSRGIGIFNPRIILMVMPVGFSIMAIRFVLHSPGFKHLRHSIFSVSSAQPGTTGNTSLSYINFLPLTITLFISGLPALAEFVLIDKIAVIAVPMIIVLVTSAIFGCPIFVVLGGSASLLFLRSGGTTSVIPNEAYTLLTGPTIPSIPLFTIAGFILSESKAGERLVRLFRAFFGWLPGGLAVMTILICTFFTALTGASSVTILALGGLLSFVLVQNGYSKRFSIGIITVNGIGSLFPPSLPIIMYGVVAQINIKHMFVAVLIPCFIMIFGLITFSVFTASKRHITPIKFNGSEAFRALGESLWEILIPFVILIFYFGGITTLVETGAITVLYVTIVETLIKRDMGLKRLSSAILKSLPIIGGVLVILSVAKGLSYFIVDAEVPMKLAEFMQSYVTSRYVFLILLNITLLIVGCFMDIFSAIIVVVPLLLPLAEIYGISPLHLGAIFLANMEIGLLTPPIGLNLFLASYQFNEPLMRIFRYVFPFFVVMIITLVLITYVPSFSTFLVDIFFK